MQVTIEDGKLFYKLFSALLGYVNRKLNVVSEQCSNEKEYTSLSPQTRGKVRDALYSNRELIDQFVAENPAGLSPEELEIVASWKHALVGRFYILRYLKKYTIFLSAADKPHKAYGVLGLADPMEEVVGRPLPVLCNAVLLPLKQQIIYDGLIAPYSIFFGGGVRRNLNEDYNRAKEEFGIITSLGEQAAPLSPKPKPKPKKATQQPKTIVRLVGLKPASGSGEAKSLAGELIEMTDAFCKEFLNEEYAELCRRLATALARKRPSPLLQGKLDTWACGVVRTIGWVNYLDDRSQKPHLKLPFIDKAFGVAESTGQGKSKLIRKMFKIRNFDPKWTLPSRMEDNPLVWMLTVNGFMMDIRNAPREAQVVAFEKGLIPYIPADRAGEGE
jgi:hypothetical protein